MIQYIDIGSVSLIHRLICPHDRHLLEPQSGQDLKCVLCSRRYPVEDGVVRFMERPDDFYEGAYENHVRFNPKSEKFWHVWPLWLVNSGYPWLVRKFVPQGASVIELGCAGGVVYFGKRYRMIGCDLSLSSLRNIAGVYEACIQADASQFIPLPDDAVDAVVSSYFWEHIPPDLKPSILRESRRVLRPGGKLVFLYDVETDNPLIRHYKKESPMLYYRLFIEGDGHLGYQSPEENLNLFRTAGFRILEHIGLEKTWLQSSSVYTKLAEYGGVMGSFFTWARVLGRHPFFYPYTALMRIVDAVVCPWLPEDRARIVLVVCEKDAA